VDGEDAPPRSTQEEAKVRRAEAEPWQEDEDQPGSRGLKRDRVL
jgi:hypothetical protein